MPQSIKHDFLNGKERIMQTELTNGERMLFDPIDADLVNERLWFSSSSGYAAANIWVEGKQRKRQFHRLVLSRIVGRELIRGEDVDHINRDKLDNRRSNLRIATRGQNMANRSYKNTTGFRGVYVPPASFIASIKFEHTKIYIGSFRTIEEAAWMYDQYAIELHGEFATLNFEYV